jgi:hypothetical protein
MLPSFEGVLEIGYELLMVKWGSLHTDVSGQSF